MRTATPSPSATPTTVPVPCAPRPPVSLTVTPNGAGGLQVTVRATTNAGLPSNPLGEVRFGVATNALIDAGSQRGATGNFTVPLPPGTAELAFTVRQASAGAATTVPLVAVDGCGAWPTFVGGGPAAF
jgi:hypothetical protein